MFFFVHVLFFFNNSFKESFVIVFVLAFIGTKNKFWRGSLEYSSIRTDSHYICQKILWWKRATEETVFSPLSKTFFKKKKVYSLHVLYIKYVRLHTRYQERQQKFDWCKIYSKTNPSTQKLSHSIEITLRFYKPESTENILTVSKKGA